MATDVFFNPDGAWVGDVIPYEHDGVVDLFYLYEGRADPKPGMPWHRLRVRADLAGVDEFGLAFPSGGAESADFNIYTGSVVRDDTGTHHMFYTGQNPVRTGSDGLPLQVVMHATSDDDMVSWRRDPEFVLGAGPGYVPSDWRDPFVFYDEERGLWRMLITARHATGPMRRTGVIAQCISRDLLTWEHTEPFWNPRRYLAHECPEVFQMGDWWYLVYSEFTDAFTTRYRMARSLDGPWEAPRCDTLDGRAFYAAKSASVGGRRLFFGWISTRSGEQDDGDWQWAGTLSVLEASQRHDGTLAFHPTPELLDSFGEPFEVGLGTPRLVTPDGYLAEVSTTDLPEVCRVSVRLEIAPETTEVGLLLRSSQDGDSSYSLRLEPRRGRMVFDRWPRRTTGSEQWQISGDVPYLVELERPCLLEPGEHTLEIILAGSICVATLDNSTVLSTRMYDKPSGRLGVFVGEGAVTVNHLAVATRPGQPTNPSHSSSKEM